MQPRKNALMTELGLKIDWGLRLVIASCYGAMVGLSGHSTTSLWQVLSEFNVCCMGLYSEYNGVKLRVQWV